MKKIKLKRLSIGLSAIAWLLVAVICLVPMGEGGLAAFACLIMLTVFTVIIAVDIFGTRALISKERMGCLAVLYFIGWSLVLGHSALLMFAAPFALRGEAAKTPWWGKLCFAMIFAVPTAFALAKILIGVALRRAKKEEEEFQPSAAPLPTAPRTEPPERAR